MFYSSISAQWEEKEKKKLNSHRVAIYQTGLSETHLLAPEEQIL